MATVCNIKCRYCSRTIYLGEELQGLRLAREAAVEEVRSRIERGETVSGVVVSGPGEPLANAATFVVLRCSTGCSRTPLGISTNGLLLRDCLEQAVADGVRNIAINTFWPETAKRVYSLILSEGRRYSIVDAAEFLLRNQWQGLMLTVDAGLHVTVNTAFLPGANERDIPFIADKIGKCGVKGMNILQLVPGEGFKDRLCRTSRRLQHYAKNAGPFSCDL